MTRIDHDERRREIVAVVWRLMEAGGPEAASVRSVVAASGMSSGSVRYFFRSQAELHLAAMTSLAERVQQRVATATREPDMVRRVIAMVAELVPLRDDTEREFKVWMAFAERARSDAALAGLVDEQAKAMRAFLRTIISDLVTLGLRAPDTDIAGETIRLHAVIDGLSFQLLVTPRLLSRAEAQDALSAAIFPKTRHNAGDTDSARA